MVPKGVWDETTWLIPEISVPREPIDEYETCMKPC